MEIISYLPPSPYCSKILELLSASLPGTAVEVCESLAPFLKRLLRPSRAETFLLIVPADHNELDSLLSNIDLLRDMPLVLVAPDLRSHTLAKSHRLLPRFLTDRDADPKEAVGVLTRILERFKETNPDKAGNGGPAGGGPADLRTISARGGFDLRLS